MRVVAGELRGRKLRTPPDERARPTTDRVREALFNALGSLDAVEGERVLDLFAGPGALGIVAVSRGADLVTFVEQDRRMAEVLRANLADLAIGDRATVHVGDAFRWLAHRPADEAFDLALLDPPYTFDRWIDLLEALPAPLAVVESDRLPDLPAAWGVVRQKRYGGTIVAIVERASSKHVGDT